MSKDFASLVSECDRLIKSGQLSAVSALMAKVHPMQVPRQYCHALAKICRRAGLLEKGLRILYPLIRLEQDRIGPVRPNEVCEYAVLLSRIGSIREALELLEEVDSRQTPEALLYQGFCHVSNWDYERAAGFFATYIQSSPDSYSELIARVNLSSCYLVTGEFGKATVLLDETIVRAQALSATRLIGNCHELKAQAAMLMMDFKSARDQLQSALRIFGQARSYDQLLILKWQAVIAASETKSLEPLIAFRSEAEKRRHWESVRDVDYFSLKIRFEQNRFDHLVIGTAAEGYRRRIMQESGMQPSSFLMLGNDSHGWMDLKTGETHGIKALNAGKKVHQVFVALTRDLYAPRSRGTLFAELYPGEFYDVNTSPLRLRQALTRTRRWLEQAGVPLRLEAGHSGYQIRLHGNFGLRLPLDRPEVSSSRLRWEKLSQCFAGSGEFTVREACRALHISPAQFLRLARAPLGSGQLEKTGRGKATRYRISSSWPKAG